MTTIPTQEHGNPEYRYWYPSEGNSDHLFPRAILIRNSKDVEEKLCKNLTLDDVGEFLKQVFRILKPYVDWKLKIDLFRTDRVHNGHLFKQVFGIKF